MVEKLGINLETSKYLKKLKKSLQQILEEVY